MSEETAVISTPASESGATATAVPQETQSTPQGAGEPQSQASTQVEAEQKSISSSGANAEKLQSRRPSAFWELRQENRTLNRKIAELEQKFYAGQSQAQAPATPKPQFRFNSDDEIYQKGLAPTFNQLVEMNQRLEEKMQLMEQGMPTYFEQYQKQQENAKLEQEIEKRISKYKEQGYQEKVVEILEKKPVLNSISKLGTRETLDALNEIDEMIKSETEKANKDPLAPKKSRMGISGSGNPIDGGRVKPDLNTLKERKAKLQEQFGERHSDPKFMEEWNKLKSDLVNLSKEYKS